MPEFYTIFAPKNTFCPNLGGQLPPLSYGPFRSLSATALHPFFCVIFGFSQTVLRPTHYLLWRLCVCVQIKESVDRRRSQVVSPVRSRPSHGGQHHRDVVSTVVTGAHCCPHDGHVQQQQQQQQQHGDGQLTAANSRRQDNPTAFSQRRSELSTDVVRSCCSHLTA